MIAIPGYQLVSKLGEGTQSAVYRGFEKAAPDRPLSIKVFKTNTLTERQRAHYRQKVEHLRVLRDQALLTPQVFDIKGGVPFVVQDYFEGLPLDEWTRRQPALSLDGFFTIACHLASALDKVHEAGVVHGGIKPRNILVHPTTLETRLTGFVTPLDVRDASHFIYDPAFVSGTLAYTSPEQTGRIHHVVVFSSDLYSLGIVFYELLAGRLPFRSTDPLALIHQHLAEEAPPVHEVNPEIPATLGRIVAKLTVKHPEKRYQSGRGLFADLIRCRTEWEVGRAIGRFPLATQDRSRRVVFVSKIVGRDDEARAVLDAYESATQGEFRAVFISGMPGIGKTRLIQELQQPIVRHRGYFTSGKFDIYQKSIPYSSITQALRNLIRTFLTESQERVAAWRGRILEAVGQSGQVLIDVIPELEALIGPQSAVPPLPPVEARNRFHNLVGRFLGALASAESPLCLFIDDLQWCDVASFDFLQTVFANPEEHPSLLLLGAYRDNEVDSSHPLARLIASVRAGGKPLEEIRLQPLESRHCHEMVSHVLDAPLSHTEALADFLADLTEGNALFVSESLSYLYNEDLLYVDEDLNWRWDLERIRRSNMPSTVVGLFTSKISKLPRPTVDLLETAACMGNTVAPQDLARVGDLAVVEIFDSLKPALGQGLLIENRGQLQFIHDRVQEAVLTGIPAERRRAIHWRAGERLLAAAPAGADLEALDDLFAIASHLNLGRPEPFGRADALRLADVNFQAGEKALNALATEAANGFFAAAKDMLPADCWEAEYEKTFRIFKKAAKTELMCGHQERSDALLDALLEHARTDLDKAECLADQTTSLSSIGNFSRAIETGNRGLAFFGKAISDDPSEADRRREELAAEIASRGDIWKTILGMPRTSDRKSKIELALYSELVPDLYLAGRVPQLYLTAAQSTEHCLAGGMDDSVIYAFCAMGLMHAEREEFELSFKYEDLVRDLSARFPNTFGATRGLNGNAWVLTHTRGSADQVVNICLKALESGKTCGDLYTAGLSYGPLMWALQVQGADLGAVEEYARECQRLSERYNLAFSAGMAESIRAGWLAPMKKGYEPVPMEERERARILYLDAIESAHEGGYTFLEGHLNECLGELQLERGRGPARPFFMEAARLYRRCRAERKELWLHERHPEFLEAEAAIATAEVEAPAAAPYALPQLDVGYLMRSALAISAEIEGEAVLHRIMQTVIESSGAQHGYLLIDEDGHPRVRAETHAGAGDAVRTVSRRLEEMDDICTAMVRYVLRTGQRLVLADASQEGEFKDNPQVRGLGLRSVLCLPVVKQGRLTGVLYLENRLAPSMFTPAGIQTTELLAAQAAISLENSRLVDEMKRAEGALAREREHLAVTLHSIGDAVIATDTTSRVVMVNRVAEQLTGWSQAEAWGRPLAEIFRIVNEKTGEPAEDPVRKVLESGTVVGLANHTALISRDGRRPAIADSAAPIRGPGGEALGVVLVFRDVTESRRAEQALEQSEEALRRERDFTSAVVDTAGALVIVLDLKGRIMRFNRECERVTGYSAAEAQGHTLWELGLIPPEQQPGVREVWEALARGEFPNTYENQWMARDGLRRLIAWSNTASVGADGRLEFIIGTGTDISERKRFEEELRAANARLVDEHRHKNEFLAMLSHELRNPLAPIRNSLYILDRAAPGGAQARRAHEVIDRQVEHMTRLIEDLLDITRITRGKIELQRERLDLNELAQRTVEDHRSVFVKSEIEVDVVPAPDQVWISGDQTRLAQAIGNLLQNAAKFTPRGGKTTVSVLADPTKGQAVLTVQDTGRGIPQEIMPRLFEAFTQADTTLDRSMGGLGLGLALVKGLVELHGGSVSVESDGPGRGATFTIALPMDATAAPRVAVPLGAGGEGKPRRMLVIDDNSDAADSLREALELGGHEVAVAYDGPGGLAKARELHPDVVICDIGLPGTDGYEVARAMRADPGLGRVVLVALTGYAQPEDVAKAREAGFDRHLAKPLSMEKLEQLLASLPPPREAEEGRVHEP